MKDSTKIDLSALAAAASAAPSGDSRKGVFEGISRDQLVRP